ncbi:MAG: hypothetical protein IPI81_13190 [Flavobacteriales bacterium]|nr:hypothetical protein [Flavobacteriales bacterium]MCC6938511.1 hypothetical protein [Flavobacteriales bacterium]
MEKKNSSPADGEATPAEQSQVKERTYAMYVQGGELGFDPMKELNLPGSYDEVVSRFKRLQGSRAMESLN